MKCYIRLVTHENKSWPIEYCFSPLLSVHLALSFGIVSVVIYQDVCQASTDKIHGDYPEGQDVIHLGWRRRRRQNVKDWFLG